MKGVVGLLWGQGAKEPEHQPTFNIPKGNAGSENWRYRNSACAFSRCNSPFNLFTSFCLTLTKSTIARSAASCTALSPFCSLPWPFILAFHHHILHILLSTYNPLPPSSNILLLLLLLQIFFFVFPVNPLRLPLEVPQQPSWNCCLKAGSPWAT